MSWNNLSMADRAAYIKLGLDNGITDLGVIRSVYNKYDGGGNMIDTGAQLGETILRTLTAYIGKKLYDSKVKSENIGSKDDSIGTTEDYGWDNSVDRNFYTKERLKKAINPSVRISPDEVLSQGFNYVIDAPYEGKATKDDKAFWERHLGYPRDSIAMPYTSVRFLGDLHNKNANKEYTGLSKSAKEAIRKAIESGEYDIDENGAWSPVKESRFIPEEHEVYTTHLGDFSIRENNKSGIYDIFDTYDFPDKFWFPYLNRKPGYEIEVRDTLHTNKAKPYMYNPMFTTKKH